MSISQEQQRALDMAREGIEGRLWRWPGGYWTNDPWHGDRQGQQVPHKHVGTQTVDALVRRGYFTVVKYMKRGDYEIVELTK